METKKINILLLKPYIHFSPEYHDVIRGGRGVSRRPNLDDDLYKQPLNLHSEVSYPLSDSATEYANFVVNAVSSELFNL